MHFVLVLFNTHTHTHTLAPLFYVEHFSNSSIAAFAEGFLVFFWPLTKYPLIFFKESDEVGLFFLFYPKNFFLFPLDRDSRYFFLLFLARVFLFFSGTVNTGRYLISKYIYIYIYIYIYGRCIYFFLLIFFQAGVASRDI